MFNLAQTVSIGYAVGIVVTVCFVVAILIDGEPRPSFKDIMFMLGMSLLWPVTCFMVIHDAILNRRDARASDKIPR